MKKATSEANRRRSNRRPTKKSTTLKCFMGAKGVGPNIAKSLLDLSETGAALVVKSKIEVGDEMEITLANPLHQTPIKLIAQVIWAIEAKENGYCVGVQFRTPLSYRHVLEL